MTLLGFFKGVLAGRGHKTSFFVVSSTPGFQEEVISSHHTLTEAVAACEDGEEVREGDLVEGDIFPRSANNVYPVVASRAAWPA